MTLDLHYSLSILLCYLCFPSETAQLLTHRGLLFKPLNTTFGAYKLTFSYPMVRSDIKTHSLLLQLVYPLI